MILEYHYLLLAVLATLVLVLGLIVRATMDKNETFILHVCKHDGGIRMRGKVLAEGCSAYDAVCNWYSKKPQYKDWFVVGTDKLIITPTTPQDAPLWELKIVSADVGQAANYSNSFSL